ncbi:MAG TPA: hypothetical protein VF577_07685 [Allosphingosinicella sp.]|jgi:hypothetical protein
MMRLLIPAAASLALASCGVGGGEENRSNEAASAASNLAETLPNELGGDDISDANLGNAAESAPAPPAPVSSAEPNARGKTPAAKVEPRRSPPVPLLPPVKGEPDPHSGHDLSNSSD